MMSKKLVDLSRAEATLRLQHQTDGGRGRRVQTVQTVLNHMDGLVSQYIQLKPWLIAQPLGHAQSTTPMLYGARSAQGPQRSSRSITTPRLLRRLIRRSVRTENDADEAGASQARSHARRRTMTAQASLHDSTSKANHDRQGSSSGHGRSTNSQGSPTAT